MSREPGSLTPVLRENFIHLAAVDVSASATGPLVHYLMAPSGLPDPQWHGCFQIGLNQAVPFQKGKVPPPIRSKPFMSVSCCFGNTRIAGGWPCPKRLTRVMRFSRSTEVRDAWDPSPSGSHALHAAPQPSALLGAATGKSTAWKPSL